MSRVTMKDVAEVMGVSVMTVSNAFNRPDQLSVELRGRILSRAEKMGYGGPSAAARHLRSGRTNCYGIVFSESLGYAFNDPFIVTWLAGLSEPLAKVGASIVLLPVPHGDEVAMDSIRQASVDGIAGLCASHPAMRAALQIGVPVVCTDPDDDQLAWVAIDDLAAGTRIGEHVRRLGHREVVVVVEQVLPQQAAPQEEAPASFQSTLAMYGRLGFYDTWARVRGIVAGLGEDCHLRVVTAGVNSRESGRQAGPFVLDRQDRPTAIVCVSDVLALGVLDAMGDRGLVPGRDVSITGFDDLPDAARAGLTTVRQPIAEKGRLVGELLLDPERQPRQIMLPHELVVRASTAPLT